MKREIIRLVIGTSVILTHFIAFFGIVVWQKKYIPDGMERIDAAMLLVPVSAGYVLAVVRSAIQRKEIIVDEEQVNVTYVVTVILVTVAFCFALMYFVFGYPDSVGPTPVELKRWLVVLEIGFGGGFGLIAEDLFGRVERIPPPSEIRESR